jgi:NADPH:quinone reductase-like Zn-dependent oxidoreductase
MRAGSLERHRHATADEDPELPQALCLIALGSPDPLRRENLAILSDGAGRVREVIVPAFAPPQGRSVQVRMLRAPVNPADVLAINGQYSFPLDQASPLGAEGVGIVDAVGPAVNGLKRGDIVLPLTRGNWCRHRVLDQRDLVLVPPGIDHDQAAMLRINPITASLLLDGAHVGPGDTIVQNGAGSAVARWIRFLGSRRGVAVIDVVRRANSELCDAIVDGPDLAAKVKEAAPGPVRAVLDCVAGEATGRAAECLARGGRIMVFGHLSGAPVSVRSQLLTGGGLSITGFSLRPAEAALGRDEVQRRFAVLLALVQEGAPVVPVNTTVPLGEVDNALAIAREGAKGRVLLDLTA